MPECKFVDHRDKAYRIGEFLRSYGDGLPEIAIDEATKGDNLDHFVLDCNESNDIVSAVTWERNDWYLCTVHYLATHDKYRGKGLGSKVVEQAMKDTAKDPLCLVLAADITYNNHASKAIFKRNGFEEKSRFCFGAGEDPGDVLHYVRFPAKCEGDKCVCPPV